MGSLFKPKMPPPPQIIMPEVKEVPNYQDEAREKEAREALEASERKRKGRRSTILTGTGLTTEPELYKKTLLGA